MAYGNAAIELGRPRLLARGFRTVADLLLPPLCPCCEVRVDATGSLCGTCWSSVQFISDPVCDRLGVPLPYAIGDRQLSPAAIARPPAYDRARAAALYSGATRDLIHALKYGDRHDGVGLLSGWLAHAGRALLEDADFIVSAPLHRSRLWSRRFNQAALLADGVARHVGVPHAPFLLERSRATKRQVGMTALQRRRNVRGAFRVASGQADFVKGKSVVLIDDVLTTGATAEACARALKRAGAIRVDVLVAALAGVEGAA